MNPRKYPHEAPWGYPIDKAIDICGCLKLVTRDTQKFHGEYHIFPYKESAIKLKSKPPLWDKPISSHVHYSILKSELLIVTPACFTIILLNHHFMCFFSGTRTPISTRSQSIPALTLEH
jgi:hypothetical protein